MYSAKELHLGKTETPMSSGCWVSADDPEAIPARARSRKTSLPGKAQPGRPYSPDAENRDPAAPANKTAASKPQQQASSPCSMLSAWSNLLSHAWNTSSERSPGGRLESKILQGLSVAAGIGISQKHAASSRAQGFSASLSCSDQYACTFSVLRHVKSKRQT